MNGPEHYKEAERLIGMARGTHEDEYADSPVVAHRLAEAQVRATLALAAATAGHRTTWTDESFNTTATYVEGDWSEVTQ